MAIVFNDVLRNNKKTSPNIKDESSSEMILLFFLIRHHIKSYDGPFNVVMEK